ncbi:MAG: NAD(P)/FAD-dependent oxidoreductase [Candidatus Omnitrophota bacterium]
MRKKNIIVVGAGAGGMMAAIRAKQISEDVTLLEKKPTLGNKLLLSGKGRCNLTNACELDEFLARFSKNGEFLRDSFKKFFNQELMDFFQTRGLKLKIERQLRVFPVTDRSSSILEVLKDELEKLQVKVICKAQVDDILLEEGAVKGVVIKGGLVLLCTQLILATGGASYSFTGSDGSGINISAKLGHKVIPLRPGLVPLEAKQGYIKELEGLTLKNVRIGFFCGKKQVVSEVGELLFTASGISGPMVLSLSGSVVDWLKEKLAVHAEIDLKPALSKEQLDNRLLREFKSNSRKTIRNTLKTLLPLRLIDVFIRLAGVDSAKVCSQITQEERAKFISLLKGLRLDIISARPLDEAIVTRGGVCLKDINPRTMESRLIKGLYFCGEMIDIDADTGGFNLQAAFSTGYLAGESAALS